MFFSQYVIDEEREQKIVTLLNPYNTIKWSKNKTIEANEKNFIATLMCPYGISYGSLKEWEDDAENVLGFLKWSWLKHKDLTNLLRLSRDLKEWVELLRISIGNFFSSQLRWQLYDIINTHPQITCSFLTMINTEFGKYTKQYLTLLENHANTLHGKDKTLYLLYSIPWPPLNGYHFYTFATKILGRQLGYQLLARHLYIINNIYVLDKSDLRTIYISVPNAGFQIPERMIFSILYTFLFRSINPEWTFYFIPYEIARDTITEWPCVASKYLYGPDMCVYTWAFRDPFKLLIHSTTDMCVPICYIVRKNSEPELFFPRNLIVPAFAETLGFPLITDGLELFYEYRDTITDIILNLKQMDTAIYQMTCCVIWQMNYALNDFNLVQKLSIYLMNAIAEKKLFISNEGDLVFNKHKMKSWSHASKNEKNLFKQRYHQHPLLAILLSNIGATLLGDEAFTCELTDSNDVLVHVPSNYTNMFNSTGSYTMRLAPLSIEQTLSKQFIFSIFKSESKIPANTIIYKKQQYFFDRKSYFLNYHPARPERMFFNESVINYTLPKLITTSNPYLWFLLTPIVPLKIQFPTRDSLTSYSANYDITFPMITIANDPFNWNTIYCPPLDNGNVFSGPYLSNDVTDDLIAFNQIKFLLRQIIKLDVQPSRIKFFNALQHLTKAGKWFCDLAFFT